MTPVTATAIIVITRRMLKEVKRGICCAVAMVKGNPCNEEREEKYLSFLFHYDKYTSRLFDFLQQAGKDVVN